MLSVTLLILQIVGLLTQSLVLGSLVSNRNDLEYIPGMICDLTDKTTCEKAHNYKWEVLALMIFYLVGIVFYAIAIYLEHKQSSKFPVFVLIGSICSLIGVALVVHMLFSLIGEIKKESDGQSTINLWFASAPTLVFSVIAVMLGGFKSINKLRK